MIMPMDPGSASRESEKRRAEGGEGYEGARKKQVCTMERQSERIKSLEEEVKSLKGKIEKGKRGNEAERVVLECEKTMRGILEWYATKMTEGKGGFYVNKESHEKKNRIEKNKEKESHVILQSSAYFGDLKDQKKSFRPSYSKTEGCDSEFVRKAVLSCRNVGDTVSEEVDGFLLSFTGIGGNRVELKTINKSTGKEEATAPRFVFKISTSISPPFQKGEEQGPIGREEEEEEGSYMRQYLYPDSQTRSTGVPFLGDEKLEKVIDAHISSFSDMKVPLSFKKAMKEEDDMFSASTRVQSRMMFTKSRLWILPLLLHKFVLNVKHILVEAKRGSHSYDRIHLSFFCSSSKARVFFDSPSVFDTSLKQGLLFCLNGERARLKLQDMPHTMGTIIPTLLLSSSTNPSSSICRLLSPKTASSGEFVSAIEVKDTSLLLPLGTSILKLP